MVSHSTMWTQWIDTIYGEPLWPHGHYELIQYVVSHSTMWTLWIDTIYSEPLDHVDTMNWYNTRRDTWPCGHHELIQYMVRHSTMWATYCGPLDHVGYILRATMTTWTQRIDTICGELLDHVDTMNWYNTWWDTWPCGHYELIQYMVRHSIMWATYCEPLDHVGYILRATMTTWTLWIDTIHGDLLDHVGYILRATWPCGLHIASHYDHMDTMNWYNTWW
jgi:hypothetical protein